MDDLLSPLGLARLAEDMGRGPLGTDAVSAESAEFHEPLAVMVLCPENRLVVEGWSCPHTCAPGRCEGCPAHEC